MKFVKVRHNNAKDEKEEDKISINNESKLDEEDNIFEYCQNNDDDSDKEKYINYGDDTVFGKKLVWEDIYNDLVIPDIPDHYCGPHGLKKGTEKLFKTVLEYIMVTSSMSLEYFRWVTSQSKQFSPLRSVVGKFVGIKFKRSLFRIL